MGKYILITVVALALLCAPAGSAIADDIIDAEGIVVLSDITVDSIPKLVELLGDGRGGVRVKAHEYLVEYGEASLPGLHAALAGRMNVQEVLAVLRSIASPSSAEPVAGLLDDDDKSISNAARGTLAALGDGAVPVTAGLLGDDRLGDVAEGVLKSVDDPSEQSRELLRARLQADNPASVRARAASVLGNWKDGYIIDNIQVLTTDPEPDVRAASLEAYGMAGSDYDRMLLFGLLRDESPKVRAMAAGMLTQTPHPDNIPVLTELASDDPDGMVRSVALNTLGSMNDDSARETLMKGLSDPDPNVVVSALWFVDEYKMVEAVPVIEELFRSGADVTGDTLVVQEALYRLAELGVKVDLGPFLGFIGPDYDGKTRKLALKMIAATGTSGDKAAITAVEGMLADEKESTIRQLGEKALESLRE